jgi:hypothetical protein
MYKQDEARAPLDPSSRIASRLKVAVPMHMAKKNSFLSAPKIVRGRETTPGGLQSPRENHVREKPAERHHRENSASGTQGNTVGCGGLERRHIIL